MNEVYLVTSKNTGQDYGDDLWVEGVFSTFEKAQQYANQQRDIDQYEYKITQMAIDEPGNELNGESYPFASYFE